MAVNGTHDYGEEWKQKSIFRQDLIGSRATTVTVGLYNDSTDNLSESNDIGDITTEPSSGNYARQTVNLDSTDLSIGLDGSNNMKVTGSVTFDTLDTGETVDGYFLIVSFQSDVVNSEGSANDHIILSSTFGTKDLSQYLDFTVTFNDTLS